MFVGTSNKVVPVYPAIMWQVLKIVLALLALCATASAAEVASIEIKDLDGKAVRPFDVKDRKAVLFVFTTNDCPIANGYAPELQRICEEYEPKGVSMFLIHVDPALSSADAKKHAVEFGFRCPVLFDKEHKLAKASGATVTPEAALYSPDGKLQYLGRIDDKHIDFGKKRTEPTRRDLRLALDDLLAGKPILVSRAKATGCFIPELEGAKK